MTKTTRIVCLCMLGAVGTLAVFLRDIRDRHAAIRQARHLRSKRGITGIVA